VVVLRFVETTPASSTPTALVASLLSQLQRAYRQTPGADGPASDANGPASGVALQDLQDRVALHDPAALLDAAADTLSRAETEGEAKVRLAAEADTGKTRMGPRAEADAAASLEGGSGVEAWGALKRRFRAALEELPSAARPLVLFIDALDQADPVPTP